MPQTRPGTGQIVVRSLIVGLLYALASALVAGLLGPLTRLSPTADNLLVWLFTGTVVCLAFAPFVVRSTWSRHNTILAVWAALVFVRSLGLGIEGSLFKPAQAVSAVLGAVFGIFISLLVAWLVVLLLMPRQQQPPASPTPRRIWWGWIWRVLLVGLAYFVFYFIFGAANAVLYTRPFYQNNPQYGLSLPPTGAIFLAQLIRGPLFGLGSLFIVRATNAPPRRVAVWLGILLFIIGGFAPYVEQIFRTMPLGFNLATLTEILLQNCLTGVVAANLYKK